MFESALFSYLSGHAGLSALIGSRIYPSVLPSSPTLPAVVYGRASTVREVAHDGRLDLANARFQFDAWGRSYGAVKAVAEQLRIALLGFAGTMDGVRATVPRQEMELDLYEDETDLHRVTIDFRVWQKD